MKKAPVRGLGGCYIAISSGSSSNNVGWSASRCYREWGYLRAITSSVSSAFAIAESVSSLEWCRPSSMLAMVDLLIPEASASCLCVIRFSLRRILINAPICWVGFIVISPLRFQIAQMNRLNNFYIEHPLPVDQM